MKDETVLTLTDEVSQKKLKVKLAIDNFGIWIAPEGYGDAHSEAGEGWPIKIDWFDSKLQVLIWDDINEQDPKTVSMEGALESERREE